MMASRQARETDHASAADRTGICGERIMADAMFLCLSGVDFPNFSLYRHFVFVAFCLDAMTAAVAASEEALAVRWMNHGARALTRGRALDLHGVSDAPRVGTREKQNAHGQGDGQVLSIYL